jgi:hypothetical protein
VDVIASGVDIIASGMDVTMTSPIIKVKSSTGLAE